MSDRSYLSIGDVLALLRDEFPDITISKIRFLESRGLLDPERTPSGYRKFYEADVDRLRWILRQQREHFLPLKIIKGRLEGATADEPPSLFDVAGDPVPEHAETRALVGALAWGRAHSAAPPEAGVPTAGGPTASAPAAGGAPTAVAAAARTEPATSAGWPFAGDEPSVARDPVGGAVITTIAPAPAPASGREGAEELRQPTGGDDEAPDLAAGEDEAAGTGPVDSGGDDSGGGDAGGGDSGAGETGAARTGPAEPVASGEGRRRGGLPPAPRRAPRPVAAAPRSRRARSVETGASFTPAELAEASGLELSDIERLEEFGLLTSRLVAGVRCYDEEGLVIARLSAGFARYGVEPRHLRTFKHAAEREAGLFEQIVIPLLRQRNPEARGKATEALEELTELGAALQASLLGTALRDVTG